MLNARLIALALALAALLAAPFALRARVGPAGAGHAGERATGGAVERLVVLTPHNEQIRFEFGAAFATHCRQALGREVEVDFRAPGGTTEIRRLLEAQFTRAIKTGRVKPDGSCAIGALPYDILFGGGAYEHEVVKKGVTVEVATGAGLSRVTVPMSAPAPFTQSRLDEWFGENAIGPGRIYDPDKHWIGAALTAFGIGFNRDALQRLGLPEPRSWSDLSDPRYTGWLAMTDPRQSGSVATTYDAILNNYGWERGWRTLRAMSANARFFSATSLKPPMEISRGEAAAGPVLEFYGRYQMSALRERAGDGAAGALQYIDPPGEVFIDSDPISILRGGPNPELAAEFVAFVLSDQGQALWQFPRGHEAGGLRGPLRYELHRMPSRRAMYERHRERFMDKELDPFGAVSMAPLRGWRFLIDKVMACFAMDIHDEMREAWKALTEAQARAVADAAFAPTAAKMEELFYAFPRHRLADGTELEFTPENFRAIRDEWRNATREPEIRMAYTRFFRGQYAKVVRLGRGEEDR